VRVFGSPPGPFVRSRVRARRNGQGSPPSCCRRHSRKSGQERAAGRLQVARSAGRFTNLNVADRRPPTQNLHLCLYAREKEEVGGFHRAGVEGGFRSNGEPGYRNYGPGYYAAYLFDPDGNNIEALYRDVGNIGHNAAPTLG
jgi:hypothetical protein